VQDGKESDFGAESFGIGGDFEQGLGAGLEQQIEHWPSRSQCQRVQFVGEGEDDVKVVGVQ
jgi:phage-related protein